LLLRQDFKRPEQ